MFHKKKFSFQADLGTVTITSIDSSSKSLLWEQVYGLFEKSLKSLEYSQIKMKSAPKEWPWLKILNKRILFPNLKREAKSPFSVGGIDVLLFFLCFFFSKSGSY